MYLLRKAFQIFFFLLLTHSIGAQIRLSNPSFEDEPSDATTPTGWFVCEEYTTPDILPGFWGVYNEPSDGDTYIGLITRLDGSFESIGQRLDLPLFSESCYRFNVDLAHSKTYAGFNKTLAIRIWIGHKKCKRQQLIFESELIKHSFWRTYPIEFTPKQKSEYLIIEAFYKDGSFSRKGNILIDHMSTIQKCHKV